MVPFFVIATFIIISLRTAQGSAVPNVTVIPLSPGSCYGWPSWQGSGGDHVDLTGPLKISINQADDDGIEGLPLSVKTFNRTGLSTLNIVADLRKSNTFARSLFLCKNGNLETKAPGTLFIGKDPSNALLTTEAGHSPEVYAHLVNGVRQPGIFLGARNQTKWGFTYRLPQTCGNLDYYELKLMNLPQDQAIEPKASRTPDAFGFLKVEAL
jgi:hypothetical protein